MSRVIKFRAWDGEKIRYDVTGFEHGIKNEMAGIFLDGDYWSLSSEPMTAALDERSAIAMQFTGLTDENGVEIYEGDIVTATCIDQDSCCGATYEYTFCVQWRHHRWYFDDGKDSKRGLGQYSPIQYCTLESCCRNGDELKVIGNIYQNQELLK